MQGFSHGLVPTFHRPYHPATEPYISPYSSNPYRNLIVARTSAMIGLEFRAYWQGLGLRDMRLRWCDVSAFILIIVVITAMMKTEKRALLAPR